MEPKGRIYRYLRDKGARLHISAQCVDMITQKLDEQHYIYGIMFNITSGLVLIMSKARDWDPA